MTNNERADIQADHITGHKVLWQRCFLRTKQECDIRHQSHIFKPGIFQSVKSNAFPSNDETVKTQITFSDNGNWIYEANVKAQTEARYKLKSTWGDTGNAIVQYFKGSSSETETLIGGSGDDWYDIRLIYDFKTNRLVASYVPSTGTISTNIPINADVLADIAEDNEITVDKVRTIAQDNGISLSC